MYYIIRIAKVSGGVKGKRGKNRVPCFRRGKPGLRLDARAWMPEKGLAILPA